MLSFVVLDVRPSTSCVWRFLFNLSRTCHLGFRALLRPGVREELADGLRVLWDVLASEKKAKGFMVCICLVQLVELVPYTDVFTLFNQNTQRALAWNEFRAEFKRVMKVMCAAIPTREKFGLGAPSASGDCVDKCCEQQRQRNLQANHAVAEKHA